MKTCAEIKAELIAKPVQKIAPGKCCVSCHNHGARLGATWGYKVCCSKIRWLQHEGLIPSLVTQFQQ